jgi:orotate phosphoribosyltransferase
MKHEVAQILLDVGAVVLNVARPFRYTSGLLSPIYCDNRLLLGNVAARTRIVDSFLIKLDSVKCGVIAGTSTAGIPWAALIAEKLGKPMAYVRGKAKEHGKKKQVEGADVSGKRVVLIEDLVSTGGSACDAVTALRQAGALVTQCVSIYTYELSSAAERFDEIDCGLITLSNFSTLIAVARETAKISSEHAQKAFEWNANPNGWMPQLGTG